jgi:hypothetical protein
MFAQEGETAWPVNLGFKFGIPITDMFSARNTSFLGDLSQPGSLYTSSTPRYILGVSAEFQLPLHLRFEVDGLYKRGGFDNTVFGTADYMRTSFNQWEIPGLFKYNLSRGHFRPFIDFGASYRHISTLDQATYTFGGSPVYADNSSALKNRNSFGGVAGIGMTFKKGPLELSPELRYTRWANEAFMADGLRTNKDQGDFLLGINF